MLGWLLCLALALGLRQCLCFAGSGGPDIFADGQGKGLRPRTRSSSAVETRIAILSWAARKLQGNWIKRIIGIPA